MDSRALNLEATTAVEMQCPRSLACQIRRRIDLDQPGLVLRSPMASEQNSCGADTLVRRR